MNLPNWMFGKTDEHHGSSSLYQTQQPQTSKTVHGSIIIVILHCTRYSQFVVSRLNGATVHFHPVKNCRVCERTFTTFDNYFTPSLRAGFSIAN